MGWASITGGGVSVVVLLLSMSTARACGVIEEMSKAAKVACDERDFNFKGSDLGCFSLLLRIAWVT